MQSALDNKNKPSQLKRLHFSKMLYAEITDRLIKPNFSLLATQKPLINTMQPQF